MEQREVMLSPVARYNLQFYLLRVKVLKLQGGTGPAKYRSTTVTKKTKGPATSNTCKAWLLAKGMLCISATCYVHYTCICMHISHSGVEGAIHYWPTMPTMHGITAVAVSLWR